MSDHGSDEVEVDNGTADASAATVLIVLAVLSVIHGVYTGGLPAFLSTVF